MGKDGEICNTKRQSDSASLDANVSYCNRSTLSTLTKPVVKPILTRRASNNFQSVQKESDIPIDIVEAPESSQVENDQGSRLRIGSPMSFHETFEASHTRLANPLQPQASDHWRCPLQTPVLTLPLSHYFVFGMSGLNLEDLRI